MRWPNTRCRRTSTRAEYGGSTGVVVNSVTKSGGNSFNGRVFEYFQDN